MLFVEVADTYMDLQQPMGSPISAILLQYESSKLQYIIFIHETEKTNNQIVDLRWLIVKMKQ